MPVWLEGLDRGGEIVEHQFRREHTFRDPIHGFIRVSGPEREIIDSAPFQRLRRIRQLGTGYLVYHGAEHSRFGHSLGVMEVATRGNGGGNKSLSGDPDAAP